MPETGFTGPLSELNRATGSYPGSVRTRFSNRRPQSHAYAPLSPVLHYNPGQGDLVGAGLRAFGGVAEQPNAAPESKGAYVVFYPVVVDGHVGVIEELFKLIPLIDAIPDGFADGSLGRYSARQVVKPPFEGAPGKIAYNMGSSIEIPRHDFFTRGASRGTGKRGEIIQKWL
jgi:hypothetical protein